MMSQDLNVVSAATNTQCTLEDHVDVAFRLTGTQIPLDHGYALYSALCHILPELHAAQHWAVHRIRGQYAGPGELQLDPTSKLTLRVPTADLATMMQLAGKVLTLDGHHLTIGVPTVFPLRCVANLRAHLCIIKGFTEAEPFADAIRRQLVAMGCSEQVELAIGQRRVMRIKDKQVVGFGVAIGGLSADESLNLQLQGLGGRRRFGCGVFVASNNAREL